jgi:rhomboid-like protein
MHLTFNMIALYSVSNSLEKILGAEQFLAFYLSSGFLSCYFVNNINILTKRVVPTLGASGAILACVS